MTTNFLWRSVCCVLSYKINIHIPTWSVVRLYDPRQIVCHGTLSVHQQCVAILQGLRLGVRLVCLSVLRFPFLLEGLRLDVSFLSLSLSHVCFTPSLQEVLRIYFILVSLCYNMPFCSENRIGGVITGKIRALQGLYLKGYNTTIRF